jgi:hypothetical protein
LRRGEILLLAGKNCEARQSFLEAQKGFESLSSFRKNVRAVRENINKLEKHLAEMPSKTCKFEPIK